MRPRQCARAARDPLTHRLREAGWRPSGGTLSTGAQMAASERMRGSLQGSNGACSMGRDMVSYHRSEPVHERPDHRGSVLLAPHPLTPLARSQQLVLALRGGC